MKTLTQYEIDRLTSGTIGTGGYSKRIYGVAKRMFLSGYSLDVSISKAREKYGF